jgi:DNA-binding NarL/FixJ family response regulator
MTPITVVVAGEPRDRALCRNLLESADGIAVVADVEAGLAARAVVARLQPHLLLLDLRQRRLDGLAVLPRIRVESPRTRVVLLTDRRTPIALILEGLRRGARGYLERAVLPALLPKAVRAVDAGEAWVPRRMVSRVLDQLVRLSASGLGAASRRSRLPAVRRPRAV